MLLHGGFFTWKPKEHRCYRVSSSAITNLSHFLRFVRISTLGWYEKGGGSYIMKKKLRYLSLSVVLNYGHDDASESEAAVMHHALARPWRSSLGALLF